jgi:adenylosuccinate synthase
MKAGFNVVIGAQAGSEAKGKLSAYLLDKFRDDVAAVTMTASPNAGHTVVRNGAKLVTYHLPAAVAVMDENWRGSRRVLLGPASVINPEILLGELRHLGSLGIRIDLSIHPRAAIITKGHIKQETKGLLRIGSTAQGVGAARRDKLMRDPNCVFASDIEELAPFLEDTTNTIGVMLSNRETILHECTQGFDLCLEHGIHPRYCTSHVINPAAAMGLMGVSPRFLGHVYGVLRPYPIRVNNRTGTSGPYAEAEEITWEEVGRRCGAPHDITEMTTTTKLQRRVFEFCKSRFLKFDQICHPDYLCLQFANYLDWGVFGLTDMDDLRVRLEHHNAVVADFIYALDGVGRGEVAYIGTGPEHRQMIDVGVDFFDGYDPGDE